MNDIKIQALIVAGGSGSRVGMRIPKQFLLLKEKPIILWTLEAFAKFSDKIDIIIVVNSMYTKELALILNDFKYPNKIEIVNGGNTRFESVKNGLTKINPNAIILVHDAVRCLVSKNLIKKCIDATIKNENAVPVIKLRDSVRTLTAYGSKRIDREELRMVQTPQTFFGNILLDAFNQPYQDKFTDEASVVENMNVKINLIEGDDSNIKLTYINDLLIMEKILDSNP